MITERMSRAGLIGGTVATLLAGLSLVAMRAAAPSDAAAAAPPLACNGYGASDLDGDNLTDPVVGVPNRTPTGGIVVYGSRPGDAPKFLPGSAFAGLDASPTFGTAIARQDINQDFCDDLVVSDPDHAGGAAVDVLWGSPHGIETAGATQVVEHHGRHDGFGTAVSSNSYYIGCDVRCRPVTDLWVGAPGRAVAGAAAAGAIDLYRLGADGTAHYTATTTENDAAPYSKAAAGDRFGSVLASYGNQSYGKQSMVVGLPHATVNGKIQAGAVVGLARYAGAFHPVFFVSQNSPGFAGGAEPGDHFGAAIGTGASDAFLQFAVGVPDEDLGTVKDAGLVDLFDVDQGFVSFDGGLTQDSPGVPGVAEAGDHFGAAVAVGIPSTVECFPVEPKYRVLAIGSPGEDSGGHVDSGTAAVLISRRSQLPDESCTPFTTTSTALTQGPGTVLGGANESGDRVGASLDVTYGGNPQRTPPVVVLGVPGEDIGATVDAGTAYAFDTQTNATRVIGNLGGRRAGLRFGAVLPKEVGR